MKQQIKITVKEVDQDKSGEGSEKPINKNMRKRKQVDLPLKREILKARR